MPPQIHGHSGNSRWKVFINSNEVLYGDLDQWGVLSEDTQNKQPSPIPSLWGDMGAELYRAETEVHQRSQG